MWLLLFLDLSVGCLLKYFWQYSHICDSNNSKPLEVWDIFELDDFHMFSLWLFVVSVMNFRKLGRLLCLVYFCQACSALYFAFKVISLCFFSLAILNTMQDFIRSFIGGIRKYLRWVSIHLFLTLVKTLDVIFKWKSNIQSWPTSKRIQAQS